MSSSYHMEWKTFIEVSCIYNIHTGEKFFVAPTFEGSWVVLIRTKNLKSSVVCMNLVCFYREWSTK